MSIRERIVCKGFFVLALLLALAVAGIGCGTASSNNQGTSFLALGFFDDAEGTEGDVGTVVFLSSVLQGIQGVFPQQVPVDKDPDQDGVQGGFIGLLNNLTAQFVRTQRLDCRYDVPGSDAGFSLPSDSFPFTVVLPQAAPAAEGEGVVGSEAYAQVQIVSPDILAKVNNSKNSLPELPFRMIATCTVTAVTQAGDTLTTNEVFYTIQFTDEFDARSGAGGTGAPFETGPGTGGDLETFGDADDELLT